MLSRLALIACLAAPASVLAYLAYTPGDRKELEWLVRPRVRQVLVCLSLLGALARVPTARVALAGLADLGGALLAGRPGAGWADFADLLPGLASGVGPIALALGSGLYAYRRQWLLPRPAARLRAWTDGLGAELGELVAVLPSGDAVPVRWLERPRTAVADSLCVVYCGLARSLAVFGGPSGWRPAAWLPHGSGFFVRGGSMRWDGVDGRGRTDPPTRLPVGLCTATAWRAAHPGGHLLRPEPFGEPPAPRELRLRGARGVRDAMRWGVVERGRWRALSDADLQRCPELGEDTPGRYYLSRWAARARGLEGTRPQQPEPTAAR